MKSAAGWCRLRKVQSGQCRRHFSWSRWNFSWPNVKINYFSYLCTNLGPIPVVPILEHVLRPQNNKAWLFFNFGQILSSYAFYDIVLFWLSRFRGGIPLPGRGRVGKNWMLGISTSERLLCTPFAGQNQFFDAKTTFWVLLSLFLFC